MNEEGWNPEEGEDNELPVGAMCWCTECGVSGQFVPISEREVEVAQELLAMAICDNCGANSLVECDYEVDPDFIDLSDDDGFDHDDEFYDDI